MSSLFNSKRRIAALVSGGALLLAAGLLIPGTQSVAVAQETAAEAPAVDTYKVDAVHSSLIFRVKHMSVAYVYGRFNEFDGSIKFHPDNLGDSSFEFTVQAASVDTNSQARDNHLRSNDFFSASEMPTITFRSTSIESAGGDNYTVKGEVSLLGETREVDVDLTITGTGTGRNDAQLIGALAEFSINRSEFGMTYGLQNISDQIDLTVSIEAIKD